MDLSETKREGMDAMRRYMERRGAVRRAGGKPPAFPSCPYPAGDARDEWIAGRDLMARACGPRNPLLTARRRGRR